MAGLNIRIWVNAAEGSADFHLTLNAVDEYNNPVYTIGSIAVGDENINQRLRDMFQAFRAGIHKGKEG